MSKRLTITEKEQATEKVRNLLERREQMAKLPIESSDALWALWERCTAPHVVSAINTLMGEELYRNIISNSSYVYLDVGGLVLSVCSSDYKPWKTPNSGIAVPETDVMYEPLKKYAELNLRVSAETRTTSSVAYELIGAANAAGQIKRVWPELLDMLEREATDSVKDVERVSRIPPGFDMGKFNEHRGMCNRVLAEAHLLPRTSRKDITCSVGDYRE